MGNSLRALRTGLGWTHERAAEEMGVSRGQFIKLERGERGLTERTIALAAKAFGVPKATVIGESATPVANSHLMNERASPNVRRTSSDREPTIDLSKFKGPRDVPVYGTGVGGEDGDFRFNGQLIDHAPRPPGIEGKRDVYVVYVIGDSMAERYEDGDPVYVDPHRRPQPRDYVVVELRQLAEGEPGKAYVKRLVRRGGGKIVVEQHNPKKEIAFAEADVERLHRVIPWTELIGI